MAPKSGAPGAACPRGWRRSSPPVLEPRRTNGGTPPPLFPSPPSHRDHPTQLPCHRATDAQITGGHARVCGSLPPSPPAPPPHPHPHPRCASRRVASLLVGGGGAEDHHLRRRIGVQHSRDPVPPDPLPGQLDPTDRLAGRRAPRSHVMASLSSHMLHPPCPFWLC